MEELPSGYKYCKCGQCKELVMSPDIYGREVRYAVGHNSRGSNNSQYKGEKKKQIELYGWVYGCSWHPNADKRGRLRKHVYNFTVRDGKLFCCMLKWGVVHHKVPIKEGGTNDLENLEGKMRGKHKSDHGLKDMSDRICSICNTEESHKRHWYRYEGKWICKGCKDKLRWRNRIKMSITA